MNPFERLHHFAELAAQGFAEQGEQFRRLGASVQIMHARVTHREYRIVTGADGATRVVVR